MKTITLTDILASNHCHDYTPELITRLWKRYAPTDRPATALDILNAEGIPAADRLWLVLRLDCLEKSTIQRFRAAMTFRVASIFKRRINSSAIYDCGRAWLALAQGKSVDLEAAKHAVWTVLWNAHQRRRISSVIPIAYAVTNTDDWDTVSDMVNSIETCWTTIAEDEMTEANKIAKFEWMVYALRVIVNKFETVKEN